MTDAQSQNTRTQRIAEFTMIALRWARQFGENHPNPGQGAREHLRISFGAAPDESDAAILRAGLGFARIHKEKDGDLFGEPGLFGRLA